MAERLSKPCLEIAELCLGQPQVLPHAVAFVVIAPGKAFQRVQDSTRAMMLAWQQAIARDRPFQIDLGRPERVEDDAEAQAAIGAQKEMPRAADVQRQSVQSMSQRCHGFVT